MLELTFDCTREEFRARLQSAEGELERLLASTGVSMRRSGSMLLTTDASMQRLWKLARKIPTWG